MKLREPAYPKKARRIDIWGNVTFVGSLTIFLIEITYALVPYGNDDMGWANPWVIGSMVTGLLLLLAFPLVESRVENPMFSMDLFRIRNFTYGNATGFLSTITRGGVMIILIVLLQGIWLPLRGYSYESTSFWAGACMLPLMNSGFVISMGMFFTIIVVGLTRKFPASLSSALTSARVSQFVPTMSISHQRVRSLRRSLAITRCR